MHRSNAQSNTFRYSELIINITAANQLWLYFILIESRMRSLNDLKSMTGGETLVSILNLIPGNPNLNPTSIFILLKLKYNERHNGMKRTPYQGLKIQPCMYLNEVEISLNWIRNCANWHANLLNTVAWKQLITSSKNGIRALGPRLVDPPDLIKKIYLRKSNLQ